MLISDKFVYQYIFMDKTEEILSSSVELTSDIDRNTLYKKQCITVTFIVSLGHLLIGLPESVNKQIGKNKCVDKFCDLLVNKANRDSLKFLLDIDSFDTYLDVYNWFLKENQLDIEYYNKKFPNYCKLNIPLI